MTRHCVVCGKESSSYKCPTCGQSYCSVLCCRQHKQATNCETIKPVSFSSFQHGFGTTTDITTEDTVDAEKLKLLETDQRLRTLLHNDERLRQLLISIDRSADPASILKRAMIQDETLQHFAALCLNLVQKNNTEDRDKPFADELRIFPTGDSNEVMQHFVTLLQETTNCLSDSD